MNGLPANADWMGPLGDAVAGAFAVQLTARSRRSDPIRIPQADIASRWTFKSRHPAKDRGLVHHSDHGVQYVSGRYTERLQEAGIEPSVGNVGDSYDNVLAETINGLYKAEVIHRQSWKNLSG